MQLCAWIYTMPHLVHKHYLVLVWNIKTKVLQAQVQNVRQCLFNSATLETLVIEYLLNLLTLIIYSA